MGIEVQCRAMQLGKTDIKIIIAKSSTSSPAPTSSDQKLQVFNDDKDKRVDNRKINYTQDSPS